MKEIIAKFHEDEIMIEAAGSRLYGVTEICLLCMVVRHVILVAIVVIIIIVTEQTTQLICSVKLAT